MLVHWASTHTKTHTKTHTQTHIHTETCTNYHLKLVQHFASYKTCKAPVKSSPPTNQHTVFLQAGCPSCRPTNSVKALKTQLK